MRKTALLIVAAAFSSIAATPSLAPDTALLENGKVKVTAADFDASMTRFPEGLREEARANPQYLLEMIDTLFVNRVFAERARAAGIDQDPVVRKRLEQLDEAFLATKYLEQVQKQVKIPDLEKRAEELYKADPQRFTDPPTVSVSHILVSLQGRTRAQALERVNQVRKLLEDGGDFARIAKEYSDDPTYTRNKGHLGFVKQSDLDGEIAPAAFALRKVGEWSEPIPSRFGYHLLRLDARKDGGLRKFADVKVAIIDAETEQIRKRAIDDEMRAVRSSPDNVIHLDRINALKSDLDPAMIEKAQKEGVEKLRKQP